MSRCSRGEARVRGRIGRTASASSWVRADGTAQRLELGVGGATCVACVAVGYKNEVRNLKSDTKKPQPALPRHRQQSHGRVGLCFLLYFQSYGPLV